ncbi:MAG: FAD binding domain-containing protein [Lachnospiraceae bacterium]|nr:FAD binding domain-containing protein [Lachnospiraceae bacterium]
MITIKEYVRVKTLEEAWQLNQNKMNRILGGMLWMRLGSGMVNTAIDLSELGLDAIEENEEEFSIGAMVSLRDLEVHEGLNCYTNNAVKNALKDIVGVQFRNMATVGGSIWGRFGFSDVLTVFLALDTYVELYKGGIVPLEEFANRKADNDILVRLIVKKVSGKVVYSAMRNQSTDFPVLTCAVSNVNGTYKAVVGARPAKAAVYYDKENRLINGETEEARKMFAEDVAKVANTQSNARGSKEYRTHLMKVLVSRGLVELGGLDGN